jgi:hypothetical protein
VHFKTELEKLREDLEKSKQETEAYERVSEAYDKVAVSIYEELEETVSRLSMGVDDTEGKKLSEKFIQIVKNIQREAQEVIINYETRLENAIRVGDVFAENAIVLRRIAGACLKSSWDQAHLQRQLYLNMNQSDGRTCFIRVATMKGPARST